jgi:hypothetical protein
MDRKRYYYKDPLAAAWMAKHFAMELYCVNDDNEMAEYDLDESEREYPFAHAMIDDGCTAETWGVIINESLGRRAYVHPDSLHILEPKLGDVLYSRVGGGVSVEEMLSEERASQTGPHIIQRGGKVIQRNGKLFFWPESDQS